MIGRASWKLLPQIAKNTPIGLFGFPPSRRIIILGSEGLSVCQVSCLLWEVTHERCPQTTSRSSHCQTSRVLRSGGGETPGIALAALRSRYRFGAGDVGKCSGTGFQPALRNPAAASAARFLPVEHPSSSRNAPLIRAVRLAMAADSSMADSSMAGSDGTRTPAALASQAAPTIFAGAVVPAYGTANVIQPGEWVSIYGSNLASGMSLWNNDFPTSLGNTSVAINGKAAYLSMVSPGQINLQAPDDTALGEVPVVVTTSAGQATTAVILSASSPSFLLRDSRHVTAIIVRSNGSGAFGDGAYDILGPTGDCFGYRTVAASAGDLVELFGVGFGPTTPAVPSGKAFSGAAPITGPFSLYINNVLITPSFVGVSGAGLYQINFVVPPGLGEGDVPIHRLCRQSDNPEEPAIFAAGFVGANSMYPSGGRWRRRGR